MNTKRIHSFHQRNQWYYNSHQQGLMVYNLPHDGDWSSETNHNNSFAGSIPSGAFYLVSNTYVYHQQIWLQIGEMNEFDTCYPLSLKNKWILYSFKDKDQPFFKPLPECGKGTRYYVLLKDFDLFSEIGNCDIVCRLKKFLVIESKDHHIHPKTGKFWIQVELEPIKMSLRDNPLILGWIQVVEDETICVDEILPPQHGMFCYQNISNPKNSRKGKLPVRDIPDLENSKQLGSLEAFSVVQIIERRLVNGQMWLRLADFSGYSQAWVIERNASSGHVLLSLITGPSQELQYYRNIYRKKALPARKSPWRSSPIQCRLPIGCILKSTRRELNDLNEIWIEVTLEDVGECVWVIEKNANTNHEIVQKIKGPSKEIEWIVTSSAVKSIPVFSQPFFEPNKKALTYLKEDQVFLIEERRLNENHEMWLKLKDSYDQWIPDCIDGCNPCVKSLSDHLILLTKEKFLSFKSFFNEEENRLNETSKHSYRMEEPTHLVFSGRAKKIFNFETNINDDDKSKTTIEPPQIYPNGGVFTNQIIIDLHHSNDDVKLFYTLDGNCPTEYSFLYDSKEGLKIDEIGNVYVQVIAILDDIKSSITKANFLIIKKKSNYCGMLMEYTKNAFQWMQSKYSPSQNYRMVSQISPSSPQSSIEWA